MKNELLLKQAIELLQEVNPDELETVRVDHTKYDDGSVDFTVELTYPVEKEMVVTNSPKLELDGEVIGRLIEFNVTEAQDKKEN